MNLSLDLNLKEYDITMNVLERETTSSIFEDGCTEFLTNKYINKVMVKQTIIDSGTVDSNLIRVICCEEWIWDFDKDEDILISKVYKLQIKIYGFLLSKYHTIKEWKVDAKDSNEEELAKNDAIELLRNIINPYKHYGNI